MNIVFWIGVAFSAVILWYMLSKCFFDIGSNVKEIIENIKKEVNKKESEEDENE